jgi:ribosome-associated protein
MSPENPPTSKGGSAKSPVGVSPADSAPRATTSKKPVAAKKPTQVVKKLTSVAKKPASAAKKTTAPKKPPVAKTTVAKKIAPVKKPTAVVNTVSGDVKSLEVFKHEVDDQPPDSQEAITILRETLAEDAAVVAAESGLVVSKSSRTRSRVRKELGGDASRPPSGRLLAELVWAAAGEHKVVSPILLDLKGLSSVTDYFYIAQADSTRQIKAIADKIVQRAKEAGLKPLGQEGLNQADSSWILLDLGEVIVHLFLPESRAKYDLESFWADAPRLTPGPKAGTKARVKKTPKPMVAPEG